jgi:glutamyl-tRNA reductase
MESSIKLAMVGCNHRHSSLAARERLAFSPTQTADALAAWHAGHAETEAVLISTCNRVELYTASSPRWLISPTFTTCRSKTSAAT